MTQLVEPEWMTKAIAPLRMEANRSFTEKMIYARLQVPPRSHLGNRRPDTLARAQLASSEARTAEVDASDLTCWPP